MWEFFYILGTTPERKIFTKYNNFIFVEKYNAIKSCSMSGILSEAKKRQHYEKPSVKRKKKSEEARKRKFK